MRWSPIPLFLTFLVMLLFFCSVKLHLFLYLRNRGKVFLIYSVYNIFIYLCLIFFFYLYDYMVFSNDIWVTRKDVSMALKGDMLK